jgi:hypothetical protein
MSLVSDATGTTTNFSTTSQTEPQKRLPPPLIVVNRIIKRQM